MHGMHRSDEECAGSVGWFHGPTELDRATAERLVAARDATARRARRAHLRERTSVRVFQPVDPDTAVQHTLASGTRKVRQRVGEFRGVDGVGATVDT